MLISCGYEKGCGSNENSQLQQAEEIELEHEEQKRKQKQVEHGRQQRERVETEGLVLEQPQEFAGEEQVFQFVRGGIVVISREERSYLEKTGRLFDREREKVDKRAKRTIFQTQPCQLRFASPRCSVAETQSLEPVETIGKGSRSDSDFIEFETGIRRRDDLLLSSRYTSLWTPSIASKALSELLDNNLLRTVPETLLLTSSSATCVQSKLKLGVVDGSEFCKKLVRVSKSKEYWMPQEDKMDVVIEPDNATPRLCDDKEEMRNLDDQGQGIIFAAAGCSGSSKIRTNKNGGLNEDKFDIAKLNIGGNDDALFVGVFDGHGGPGASKFVVDRLRAEFEKHYHQGSGDVERSLLNSFLETDKALYAEIQNLAEEYAPLRERHCSCNFYREMPCRCMQAERTAHEGSTGTTVIFADEKLYCANIGDSEALLATRSGEIVRKYQHYFKEADEEDNNTSYVYSEKGGVSNGNGSNFLPSALPLLSSAFAPFSFAISSMSKGYGVGDNQRRPLGNSLQKRDDDDLMNIENSSNPTFGNGIGNETQGRRKNKSAWKDFEVLTVTHTPVDDLDNDDYRRISKIAAKRVPRKNNPRRLPGNGDGIRRGPSARLNYVALEGAHSLNMTRAFGNFGHKVFHRNESGDDVEFSETESPIIAKPHINMFESKRGKLSSDLLFVVVASDGLWDNLSKTDVNNAVRMHCRERLREHFRSLDKRIGGAHGQRYRSRESKLEQRFDGSRNPEIDTDSESDSDEATNDEDTDDPASIPGSRSRLDEHESKSQELSTELLLASLAESAAKDLLARALISYRKQDDITAVVVLFKGILDAAREDEL